MTPTNQAVIALARLPINDGQPIELQHLASVDLGFDVTLAGFNPFVYLRAPLTWIPFDIK
jgi:hypothetical protein